MKLSPSAPSRSTWRLSRTGLLAAACLAGVFGTTNAMAKPAEGSTSAACASAREYAMGVKYQQQSAEVTAVQRQTYALAKARLKEILDAPPKGKPLAIMTDLDETVMENTGFAVQMIQHCEGFNPTNWSQWEQHGTPTLIPGALAFFNYANEHGVAIYYVSNRSVANQASTLATIQKLGLPQATNEHLLLQGPSKQVRRQHIQQDHALVMQLGDTLSDFSAEFLGTSVSHERELVKQNAHHFGKDWFVLPNASYGNWSKATLSTKGAP